MTRARLWQRWRKWALVLGIFALGIPALAAVVVRSTGSRSRVSELATRAIQDELGLTARLGRVHIQLVPPSIVARDITLEDPIYGRFAEADQLRIQPSFRALLRGAIDLNVVEIRGANLRLVVRNGEIRNLPRAGGAQPEGPPTLPFDELRVVGSTLTVDAQPYATGRIEGVDLTLRGHGPGNLEASASCTGGWIQHERGRQRIEAVSARVELVQDILRIPSAEVRTPELFVAVREGRLPITLGERGYSGTVNVQYDLAHLHELPLPPDVHLPPLAGRVELTAELSSPGDTQRAQGRVVLRNTRVDQFGLGEATTVVFDANREEVRLLAGSEFVNVRGGGRVAFTGRVVLDEARGFPLSAHARIDDLSFARLMNDLGVTDNGIVDWMIDGEASTAGTLVPPSLEGPIVLRTHDFMVTHDPYHHSPRRRVIGVTRGNLAGRWSIRQDGVRFSDLAGEMPHSNLHGDVLLGFDNQLRVSARTELDMRDITPLDRFPLAGRGNARVEIDGTFQDPHVTGHLRFDDFVFDDFRLGNVESDAVLDPDGLGVRFTMVEAVKNQSRYRAEDLYLDFHQHRFAMTGLLHLDGLELADFYHVFGFEEDERFTPYQGLARGQANLRYTNGFPDDSPSGTLDVDMSLGFDRAVLNDYAFTDGRLVGRWRWLDWERGAAGGELSIAHLSLRKGEGTLTLQGRMALGGALRMTAVADQLALAELEGVGDRIPGIGGVASAVGRIGGTFEIMRADFDVGVTNVTLDGVPLGDGRTYVRLTDRDDPWVQAARDFDPAHLPEGEPCPRARRGLAIADWPADPPLRTVTGPQERLQRPMAFVVCGGGLDGRLAIDLSVGRTEALPVRGMLGLDGLDLAPFLPESPDGTPFSGSMTGMLAFDGGGLRRPETLRGAIELGQVRVAQGDVEVHNARPVELRFAGGVLTVGKARFVGPGSRLRVRGQASLDDGLGLSVDGEIDLSLAARLTRTLEEASGLLRARVNVSGPFASPELYGTASVENGRFRFASFESPIENLGGRIEFSERSVLFDGFTAAVAGGRLALSGAAELRGRGLERYRFDVQATDLHYDFEEGIDATLGGRGELTYNRGDRLPLLRGELRVGRFEYTRPIELRSLGEITASAVHGAMGRAIGRRERTEVRRYDPDEDRVRLDLQVTQQAPFQIENNLIDADVRIEQGEQPFRIVGTDQRFGVQGTMSITQGRLSFQNNEFDVRRGVIRFDDTTRVDPRLNIEAITEIRRASDLSAPSWRVLLSVVGGADDLRLTTRSEPDLPQQDILTLLAFGMTRAELAQLSAGDFMSAAALEALTSVTGVDREVQRVLPIVDDIRLTTGYSTRTGRSEPRISIGKRIADRIRLSAQTGLSDAREVRAAIEWQLDDNARLQMSYDNYNFTGTSSLGNLGLDVGYRLEFE
ncbi:MAG: translocation/assembly module TamB [Sandaracinaceae bacterium]|nr:translocation/assembly module TamB [Sandaracinaceae bacterium]